MSRIFITGSTDGLGKMTAELLIEQNHQVVLHARNAARAKEALTSIQGAKGIVIGDLSSIAQTTAIAKKINELGDFDAIIHNAGIGYREHQRLETEDGLPHVFAINTLAPYILTTLIKKPKRLIYLSSGMHHGADTSMNDILWEKHPWQAAEAYAQTKFHDVLLAFAVARLWPDVYSNALEPGWVATKMGGVDAPDDLDAGYRTQAWLAVSNDKAALVTGQYFYHQRLRTPHPATQDVAKQHLLLNKCYEICGYNLEDKATNK